MVGGTKRPPQDSESGPWSHEQSNTKSNSNTKTFHEEESQNLSRVHVSLDNADTVIEGGPLKPGFGLSGTVLVPDRVFLGGIYRTCYTSSTHISDTT